MRFEKPEWFNFYSQPDQQYVEKFQLWCSMCGEVWKAFDRSKTKISSQLPGHQLQTRVLQNLVLEENELLAHIPFGVLNCAARNYIKGQQSKDVKTNDSDECVFVKINFSKEYFFVTEDFKIYINGFVFNLDQTNIDKSQQGLPVFGFEKTFQICSTLNGFQYCILELNQTAPKINFGLCYYPLYVEDSICLQTKKNLLIKNQQKVVREDDIPF